MPIDDLAREFLIESQEGLDRMERCLTDLEQRPEDAGLLAEIFRSVHTIKGTTGFLGYRRLEKLAHAGENLLGQLRDGKLAAAPSIITVLLQLLDGLRSILKGIEADGSEGRDSDDVLIARIEQMQVATPPVAGPAPKGRARSKRVKCLPRKKETAVPATELAPNVEAPAPAVPVSTPSVPIAVPVAGPQVNAAESTLRVDVSLLNRMMNLVGELVLARNQVLQATAGDPKMTLLSRRLDMVTADLREAVMKARLQPVSNLFSKMPRLVRDLAHALHRQVRLEMEGQETELDKSLLEAIKDPLTHAVRNALDHGIEPADVRVAAGKEPEGILRLRALQEGSHVLIEVADDGAGISPEKVRAKAIERGLVPANRAGQMTERELLQLIFLPGFSTASAVTNVSGRGVGMDVVRTNVEKIGGKVEIDSRAGKGTTLRLRIPLTLAIIPVLIVRSLSQSFALPQGALSELVHVSEEEGTAAIEWIDRAPLYRLRGHLLPLVFLNRLLEPAAVDAEWSQDRSKQCYIAVLDADGRHFGLVVDGLNDPEEIVVKPLSSALKEIGLYSGATVLGSGELALILDPGSIALRAGVTLANDEDAHPAAEDASASASTGGDFLLVQMAGRRAAVPLGDVLRIEQISASQVEYMGTRPILNFDGHLLPVEDVGGLLQEDRGCPEAGIIVVVCRDGARQVGIVVSHVLDVATGGDLVEAGTGQRTTGVTLLKDSVIAIVDLRQVPDIPVDTPCREAAVGGFAEPAMPGSMELLP